MKNLLLLSFLSLLLFSCNSEQKSSGLPVASGRPGEIVIVSTKPQWNGLIGDTIKSGFQEFQYGLPQAEPTFDLLNTSESSFKKLFKTFRNVLYVKIDKNRMSKGEITYHKNVWAKGQFVVNITASSRKEWLELFDKNQNKLIKYFNGKELSRRIAINNRKGKKEITDRIEKEFDFGLSLSPDAYLASIDDSTVWIRVEKEKTKGGFKHQISQGLLIYVLPYSDTIQFSTDSLLAVRDRYLMEKIKGSTEEAYMVTADKYVVPRVSSLNFAGHYAKEIRGLWEMKNAYMGGPMYSMILLDEDRSRIIGLSGYVYAPQFDKREYLREVECMIKSIKIKKPASQENAS